MSLKLRDLIRKVRTCKTASEERAVIAKESAMIRTAIREEQVHFRHRNVAKLLFMHMLGYPTYFGQLECMKLIASPHFPEKRIGYLGMMLLLSEQADVLMLATNALKNDLNSENKFVSGLALCAIGNLATADMSRDLAPEVDKHLKSSNPYLRKKACLAMARCLTKCPDMVEDFVERVITLLKDRSHGVLITVVQLMTQVLIMDQKNAEIESDDENDEDETPCQAAFSRLVPSLVKLLRNIIGGSYASDHDGAGGSDPFLQVQILTLLRLLGVGDKKASEEMNDVLAQVATNTETAKNSGNAILYECVLTIMAVESEDGLRLLAVNILGRFLLNRDNNIRYVALNTLSKCIMEEKQVTQKELLSSPDGANTASSALQRHRTTVVDCLKDPDISIRQRALELIYHLVNKGNVEALTAELLSYLVLCPREHRAEICIRVLRVTERYSPNDRWKVDTLVTLLTIAGRECATNVQSSCIIYISQASEDLRAYATHKLLKAVRDDDGSQRGLLVVGIWCIGEYGDLLLKPYTYNPSSNVSMVAVSGSNSAENVLSVSFMALEPSVVVNTVEEIVGRLTCPEEVNERALTCYAKLCDRLANCGDTATLDKLQGLIKKDSKSQRLELQLRSCEYDALINALRGASTNPKHQTDGVVTAAKEALARMPVVDLSVLQRKRASDHNFNQEDEKEGFGMTPDETDTARPGGDLLDLADIFGSNSASAVPVSSEKDNAGLAEPSESANSGAKSDIDLLSDIFSAPAPTVNSPSTTTGGYDPFNSLPSQPSQPVTALNTFSSAPTPLAVMPNDPPIATDVFSTAAPPAPNGEAGPVIVQVLTHAGLSIEFECSKPELWNNQNSTLVAKFKNTNQAPLYGFSLQCAVPKYVTMEMKPPTSTTIPVTGGNGANDVTQTITVSNSLLGKKSLMLKLKIAFTSNGTKVEHTATFSGFPSGEF